MELGATGEKDMWMLSPCPSMLALCFIFSIWSMLNNSTANKGCQIHTFCLLVLTRMTGALFAFVVATHLLITMPRGRLWCWACSTRQVILGGMLLVCPGTVMAALPGTQTGFCFEPNVICPMVPSFLLKSNQSFFRQVICLWGLTTFNILGHNFWCCSQCIVLLYIGIVKNPPLGKNKGLTSSGHINELNHAVPYFWSNTS